jgi:hypothetical protein
MIAAIRKVAGMLSVGLGVLIASGTGVIPASPVVAQEEGLQCGWTPANDAQAPGHLRIPNSGEANLDDGPDIGCTPIYSVVVHDDDLVVVHCGWYNWQTDTWYDYLTDYSQSWPGSNSDGVIGWLADVRVNWRDYGGRAEGC